MRHVVSFTVSSAVFVEKFTEVGACRRMYYDYFHLCRICVSGEQNSCFIRYCRSSKSDLSTNGRADGDRRVWKYQCPDSMIWWSRTCRKSADRYHDACIIQSQAWCSDVSFRTERSLCELRNRSLWQAKWLVLEPLCE